MEKINIPLIVCVVNVEVSVNLFILQDFLSVQGGHCVLPMNAGIEHPAGQDKHVEG